MRKETEKFFATMGGMMAALSGPYSLNDDRATQEMIKMAPYDLQGGDLKSFKKMMKRKSRRDFINGFIQLKKKYYFAHIADDVHMAILVNKKMQRAELAKLGEDYE